MESRRIERTPEEGRDQLLSVPQNRVEISTPDSSSHERNLGKAHQKCSQDDEGSPWRSKRVCWLETLRTVFAEVVTILNSRPLTPVSDDPNDYEPLTPSHFLLQRQNVALPPWNTRKQWRRAQFLADCFWKRWIREYIPTLQQRQKWIR